MAKTKKPYVSYSTKEEFEKHFNEIYESGRAKGFDEGKIWVLSYIEDLFGCLFSKEDFEASALEQRHRHIEEWRKARVVKSIKEQVELHELCMNVFREYASENKG